MPVPWYATCKLQIPSLLCPNMLQSAIDDVKICTISTMVYPYFLTGVCMLGAEWYAHVVSPITVPFVQYRDMRTCMSSCDCILLLAVKHTVTHSLVNVPGPPADEFVPTVYRLCTAHVYTRVGL